MKIGVENRKQIIWASVLGVVAVLVIVWQVLPMFSGSSPSAPATVATTTSTLHPAIRSRSKSGKAHPEENLDPTLQLQLLAASENTKYEGSGRNIFVSQAEDVVIPKPNAQAATDQQKAQTYTPPPQPQAPPITLKFFGFANQPGEPKKIFLSQGEDVFIAAEGEIIDRRYKVVHILPTSVEIQDLVNSGPPQTVQLTQG